MEMITITATVEEIIYFNEENGYTVFDFYSDEGEMSTAVGYTANLS